MAYLFPGSHYSWHFKRGEAVEGVNFKPRHVTHSGVTLLKLARLGEGIALLDDYTVQNDISRGTKVRLQPEFRITNTTFEEVMYATILDTAMIPAKIVIMLCSA